MGRKATSALFWNTVFLPIKAGLELIVSLTIIRLFPQNAFTALATVTAFLALIGVYTDLGIERALPRFVSEVEQREGRAGLRRFILTITLIKLAILAIVILGLTFFADALIRLNNWGAQGSTYLTLIYALLVLGALYDIAMQVLYSFFRQKATNLLDIVVKVLNPVMTLLLIFWFKLEEYSVILALLITTVICLLIAVWRAWVASQSVALKPVTPKSPQPLLSVQGDTKPASSLKNRFAKYAALMYFFNISTSFYDASFAVLLLNAYHETIAVIIVRVVYNLIKTLLKNLLTPFVGVQTPLFSAIHAQNRTNDLQTAYAALSKLQIIILVPSAVGVMLLSRNLLELLLVVGNKKDAVLRPDMLDTATWATIITVFFSFTESLISLPLTVLMVYERYRAVIISRLIPLLTAPLLIVSIWLGWGAIGAVTLMGLLAVLSRLIAMLILQRDLKLAYPTAFFGKVATATLAFGIPLGALAWWLPVSWFATFGIAIGGIIIFYAVFKGLGGFDQEDKARLMSMKLPLRKYIVKYL